jgi:hypothetical protein
MVVVTVASVDGATLKVGSATPNFTSFSPVLAATCSAAPVSTAASGITSDPNRHNEPEYIVQLVGRVVTVSVETARLVKQLATAVSLDSVIGATLVESQVGAPGD